MTRRPRSEDRLTSFPSASGRVKSGAASPAANRASGMPVPLSQGFRKTRLTNRTTDFRGERAQRPAAVTDLVLVRRIHLGRREVVSVRLEDRVVAEPIRTARLADEAAGDHALTDVFAVAGHDQRRRAREPGAEPLVRHVTDL